MAMKKVVVVFAAVLLMAGMALADADPVDGSVPDAGGDADTDTDTDTDVDAGGDDDDGDDGCGCATAG
jgi:hypothetical protein